MALDLEKAFFLLVDSSFHSAVLSRLEFDKLRSEKRPSEGTPISLSLLPNSRDYGLSRLDVPVSKIIGTVRFSNLERMKDDEELLI